MKASSTGSSGVTILVLALVCYLGGYVVIRAQCHSVIPKITQVPSYVSVSGERLTTGQMFTSIPWGCPDI